MTTLFRRAAASALALSLIAGGAVVAERARAAEGELLRRFDSVPLALGGCGRKGPLDLPPTANAAPGAAASDTDSERAAQPSVFNPTYGSDAAPAATRGNKRPFVLDPLLGN